MSKLSRENFLEFLFDVRRDVDVLFGSFDCEIGQNANFICSRERTSRSSGFRRDCDISCSTTS